ncbi:rubis-subs-bind domain-containing protein, partial [Haematococcus lacustris]
RYEKKLREDSFWQPYIKELDRQRARGTQAVESPILWAEEELEELLTGSPLLATVRQRLAGIEHEYKELDTTLVLTWQVWYMACSLFNRYPFDLPTETFSFERFKQAFAAVQASIVHLQLWQY